MTESDGETWYAYFCMNKLHWTPGQFTRLGMREKAAVMAFIDQRIEEEKKAEAKAKSNHGKGRRRR